MVAEFVPTRHRIPQMLVVLLASTKVLERFLTPMDTDTVVEVTQTMWGEHLSPFFGKSFANVMLLIGLPTPTMGVGMTMWTHLLTDLKMTAL